MILQLKITSLAVVLFTSYASLSNLFYVILMKVILFTSYFSKITALTKIYELRIPSICFSMENSIHLSFPATTCPNS